MILSSPRAFQQYQTLVLKKKSIFSLECLVRVRGVCLRVVIVDHFFKNVSHWHVIYQKKGNFIPYSKLKTDLENINLKRNDGEKNIMKM